MVDDNSGDVLRSRRREFESYASSKANEIDEQRQSWRYYHADQYTKTQLRTLKKRGQPPITFDRCGRKIDGLVGVIRKLRTDPKAFPRTPNQEQGADIATQVIRTICDSSNFEDLETECVRDAAVHGFGVAELTFTTGDKGDPDFTADYVDPKTYFYDPRSVKPDFGERRFCGTYKWAAIDELDEIKPGAAAIVNGDGDLGYSTAFDTDREMLWSDEKERVRLVDHWYIEGGMWKWCLHVGTHVIDQGNSPFFDRLGKSQCKYFAFANQIDPDGDHYGYIRRLKGPQDAMNQHRSKSIHIMKSRLLIARKGALDDIELARREAARPDGVIEYNGTSDEFKIEQPAQEFIQQTQYYEDAKNEIETFGPNQALLGDLGKSASGRAMTIAQQAGLAELGPFLKNYRRWKLDLYQAMWCAAQRYWTSDRMLRTTDDEGLAQFMQVNGVGMGPDGQPALVNHLGAIDVDIIIDEGPDTESIMGDVFDTLSALAQNNVPVPPQVLIETSSLPSEVKKKINGMMSQPDPMKEQAGQLELQGKAAENQERQSKAALNMANARKAGMPDGPGQPAQFELPPEIQIAEASAKINDTNAAADFKRAQTAKTQTETSLAPLKLLHESAHKVADRNQRQDQARQAVNQS